MNFLIKKKKLLIALTALLLTALVVNCLLYIKSFFFDSLLLEKEIIFTLPVGTSFSGLKRLLLRQHLLRKNLNCWLPWIINLDSSLTLLKAGTYKLKPGITMFDLIKLLVSGKEMQFSICFIEGSTLRDCLSVLKQSPYINHDLQDSMVKLLNLKIGEKTNSILEGQFYPDTYLYTANTPESIILKKAHQRMITVLLQIWKDRAQDLPYKTPYSLLTIASIIEKETKIHEERARIASVFINRLRIGMKLQTDTTVIYGMGKNYCGSITRKDLITPTPYNTYIIKGLPPSPISMPGQASLEAAAHPENSNYLYFVANGYGSHIFTTNLASHKQAVKKYRHLHNYKGK